MKRSTPAAALVALASVLTFVALAVWLLSNSDRCSYLPNTGWASAFVVCRSANEVGDFLAGFFAPLATILLGLAVYLQSREMAETREVFQEQRDLMAAQISEAKRSADLFEKQNGILQAQETSRLKREQMAQLEATLSLIEVGIRTRLVDRKPLRFRANAYDMLTSVFQDSLDSLPIETKAAIGAATTSAIFKQSSFNKSHKVEVYKKYGHRDSFESICELIVVASGQAASIGPDADEVLNLLRLPEFEGLLQMYLDNGPGDTPFTPEPPRISSGKAIVKHLTGVPRHIK